MPLSRCARRYAAAALGLASQAACGEALVADLADIEGALAQSPDLSGFVRDYAVPRTRRKPALEAVFRDRVHPFTWRLLRFLESKRRLGHLADVAVAVRELHEAEAGVRPMTVTAAFPLDGDLAERIAERVQQRVGGIPRVTVCLDPALLGGFSVRAADWVYDLSLAGALRRARERMAG